MSRFNSSLRLTLPALILVFTLGTARADKAGETKLASDPLKVLEQMHAAKLGDARPWSPAVRKPLEQVWAVRTAKPGFAKTIDDDLLLQLILLASGVETPESAKAYSQKFAALVTSAKQTVKGKTLHERGEALMAFLHRGVMKGGYSLEQSSWTTVFDTGKFNCVSATIMYYLVGSRLGMGFHILAIDGNGFSPGHATLDLIDGDAIITLEPTSAQGFDYETKIKQPGVVIIGARTDRKKARRVDAYNLPCMIFSNRGSAGEKDTAKLLKRDESLRCVLAAVCCDPDDSTARTNLNAALVNWGPALAKAGHFEQALKVMTFARAALPANGSVANNQRFVCMKYCDQLVKDAKYAEAVKMVTDYAKAFPEKDRSDLVADAYDKWALKLATDKNYAEAVAAFKEGLKAYPKHGRLNQNFTAIVDEWAAPALKEKKWDDAIGIYQKGLAIQASNGHLKHNLEYCQQMKSKK